MLCTSTRCRAVLGADDQRAFQLTTVEIRDVRGLIDQLIESDKKKVAEHDLDNRPHPGDRGTHGGTKNRCFGNRCIEDSLVAEFVGKVPRDAEHTARKSHVFAKQEHLGALDKLALKGCIHRFGVRHLRPAFGQRRRGVAWLTDVNVVTSRLRIRLGRG